MYMLVCLSHVVNIYLHDTFSTIFLILSFSADNNHVRIAYIPHLPQHICLHKKKSLFRSFIKPNFLERDPTILIVFLLSNNLWKQLCR